jgi:monothiol glutaredoxin
LTTDYEKVRLKAAAFYDMNYAELMGFPVADLPSACPVSAKERADVEAESARLAQQRHSHLALMDRYLDSRDACDDDTLKEWVMATDPLSNRSVALLAMTQMEKTMTAQDQIKETVEKNDVVLFMKGTKMMPQCGFSSRVAGVLNFMGVDFADVNVLADAEIRQGIKDFSDWPTIPQLYVKGEFVGGCDIVTEMTLSGELDQLFEAKGVTFDKAAAEKIREANA